MKISPEDRLVLSAKIAKGIEYEIKDYDLDDRQMISAYLVGWFEGALKREL